MLIPAVEVICQLAICSPKPPCGACRPERRDNEANSQWLDGSEDRGDT